MDLSNYHQYLQILMQMDGTVTELIRLLANEPIKVVKLSEKQLGDKTSGQTLLREIILQGEKTAKNWVYAQSKILLDNLPKPFIHDLLHKEVPIGTLWKNYHTETFKQVIHQAEEQSERLAEKLGMDKNTLFLTRTYEVYSNQVLIMVITEKFPVDLYG